MAVGNTRFYRYTVGIERMDKALDCALAMLKDDVPMAAAVLRAKLRQMVDEDRRKRGDEADEYVVVVADLYELAYLFPIGRRHRRLLRLGG